MVDVVVKSFRLAVERMTRSQQRGEWKASKPDERQHKICSNDETRFPFSIRMDMLSTKFIILRSPPSRISRKAKLFNLPSLVAFFFPFLLLAHRSSYYWNERMENKKRKTFRFDWSFVYVHFTISFLKRMKNFASLHLADVLAANNWANRQWLPCSLGLLPPFMLVFRGELVV
jgi:hypothetical protein